MDRVTQTIFKKRINIRQMAEMVKLGARIKKTTFFFGGAGLGKSEKMRQVADEMFPDRKGNNLCDVRLSDKEPQDIAGIPIPITVFDDVLGKEVTRTVYAVPNFWPTDPNWKGIVFLDELPNAILGTQHAAYQVILDHVAGEHRFPKGCVFVGAGNRNTDGGGTTDMPKPLINRMIVCEVDYNLDVWIEDYAVPFGVHPHIIGYLKQFPEYFYTGDMDGLPGDVFASPRQWKTVSDILYDYDNLKTDDILVEVAIAGSVGEGQDDAVMAYHVRASKLPKIEGIFDGTTTNHRLERSENDLVFVLSQTCMNRIRKEAMDASMTDERFVQRVGNFLNFMYKNHYENNKDTILALLIHLFRSTTSNEAIVTMNPARKKPIPELCKKCPAVMELVKEYGERYGDIMKDFESKK